MRSGLSAYGGKTARGTFRGRDADPEILVEGAGREEAGGERP